MDISVIVPAHAKPNRLKLTLAGIRGQENYGQFEVIVVADGATEGVHDVLDEQDNAKVIYTPGLGRSGARNAGAKEARGDLLVFMDDDILVESSFLNAHLNAQKETPGLVHGQLREIFGLIKVENPEDGGIACPPIDKQLLERGGWTSAGIRLIVNTLEQAVETKKYASWLCSAGANISCTKDDWRKVGGFDERFGTLWGLEDLDFGYRFHQAGINIALSEEARGFHMAHELKARWEEHNVNLNKFQQAVNSPESLALGVLLSPSGSVEKFEAKLAQYRTEAVSSERIANCSSSETNEA